jgi:hypothetical protein
MRIALALVFVAHGIAHLVGVAGSWSLSPAIPFHSTIFGGRIDIGGAGMRGLGFVWLLTALAFAVAAFGVYTASPWWRAFTFVVAAVSLVLSAAEWPAARIGVAVNLGIIVAVLLFQRV